MEKKNRTLKDDIERAERNILVISWLGVLSSIAVIVSSILKYS